MSLSRRIVAVCSWLCCVSGLLAYGQTYSVLVNFDGHDGAQPLASLIQARDGNFYGTTSTGAYPEDGTVFKMTPGGTLTKLHGFLNSEGEFLFDNLFQGSDGNFYGTAEYGGAWGDGTVFRLTPEGILTVLYSFCPQPGCVDGKFPYGGVTEGTDGNFYGTTPSGGSFCNISGCGTVFKITPDGKLTTLHVFCPSYPCSDGSYPYGQLVLATDGNFYGTTLNSVFKISPRGDFTTLHFFTGAPDDGANTYAGLIQAKDGNFYGTTTEGGAHDKGTVFKITPAGVESIIYSFCPGIDCTDGIGPKGALVLGSDGNFYGTAEYDGTRTGVGSIFELTPGGILTVLHNFQGPPNDGSKPWAGLVQGNDGRFYGTTSVGGSEEGCGYCGTIFRIDTGLYDQLSVIEIGSGTVTSSDNHIYCGSVCTYFYTKGTQVSLSAVPAPGYTFGGWAGCDNMNGSYCSVTMTEGKNVTVTFDSVNNITLTSLTFKPSYVRGGQLSAGTLTLSGPAPAGGLTVALSSDHPGVAHPPSFVFVPGGKSSVQFAVQTLPVKSNTTVTITATAGSSHVNGTLTVGTTSLPPSIR